MTRVKDDSVIAIQHERDKKRIMKKEEPSKELILAYDEDIIMLYEEDDEYYKKENDNINRIIKNDWIKKDITTNQNTYFTSDIKYFYYFNEEYFKYPSYSGHHGFPYFISFNKQYFPMRIHYGTCRQNQDDLFYIDKKSSSNSSYYLKLVRYVYKPCEYERTHYKKLDYYLCCNKLETITYEERGFENEEDYKQNKHNDKYTYSYKLYHSNGKLIE